MGTCVRADACAHPRGRMCPSARTLVFTLGNFKKDATVRLSHGRPRGYRPTVRPLSFAENHGGRPLYPPVVVDVYGVVRRVRTSGGCGRGRLDA
jgi:hypothetical protein